MTGITCQICFDDGVQRTPLPTFATGNGDILRAGDCDHPICQACLARYIAVRVEEQRVGAICCPAVSCKTRLFEQDVKGLVNSGHLASEVYETFVNIRSRDFKARANDFTRVMEDVAIAEDYDTLSKIYLMTRLCPRCHLVIEKSDGCNSFYCVCGHHFNFAAAPRVVGDVKQFRYWLRLAQVLRMSVRDAMRFRGRKDFHRAVALADARGLAVHEASEIIRGARRGDEAAREQIRQLRREAVAARAAIEAAEEAEAAEARRAQKAATSAAAVIFGRSPVATATLAAFHGLAGSHHGLQLTSKAPRPRVGSAWFLFGAAGLMSLLCVHRALPPAALGSGIDFA